MLVSPNRTAMIFILSKGSTDQKSIKVVAFLGDALGLAILNAREQVQSCIPPGRWLGKLMEVDGSWWNLGKPDRNLICMKYVDIWQQMRWRKTRVPSKIHGGWKKPSGQQLWKVLKSSVSLHKKTSSSTASNITKNYSEFICWLIHSHLKSLKSLNILWWFLQLPSESPSQSSQSPKKKPTKGPISWGRNDSTRYDKGLLRAFIPPTTRFTRAYYPSI